MVSPDGIEKPEAQQTRQTVSRVGKTLTVLAPHQSKTAKAPTVMPLAVTDKTENVEAVPVTTSGEQTTPTIPQGRTPAEIASKKAITVKTDEMPTDSANSSGTEPPQPEASAAPASAPVAEAMKPAEPLTAEQAESKPAPVTPPTPAGPQIAQASTPSPAPTVAPSTTEDDISADTTESDTSNPSPDNADGQLAPNKVMDEAKKKADEAEAACDAEEEQIIDSKRFYLPIANVDTRRGLTRSLAVLLLVIVLTAIWFDVVLDAGIVHVGNLHALTHFFR